MRRKFIVADPREQAARSMMQAGITSLGANRSPRFEPQVNYEGVDRDYVTRTPGGADRIDYGYGQMMNPQGGARQIGPWLNYDYYVNPDILEDQKGLASFPGGARTFAERHRSGDFTNWDNLKDFRNMLGWMSNLGAPVDSPLDQYGYNLSRLPNLDPDMFKSKREQIEEARESGIYGDYIADQMEMYGRDNPYTQDLSKTTPNKGVFRDLGYSVRIPADIAYGYEENLDPELALPPGNIGFDRSPNPQALPYDLGFQRAGAEQALPYDLGFQRAGAEQALPPENIGIDRAGYTPALPPENIGMDRAPEEILAAPEDDSSWWDKLLPFAPGLLAPGLPGIGQAIGRGIGDYFSPDDIYRDRIMRNIPDNILGARGEFDMSEADSYSPQNLIQLYQEALDAGNEDEAEMYLNDLQLRYPTLV